MQSRDNESGCLNNPRTLLELLLHTGEAELHGSLECKTEMTARSREVGGKVRNIESMRSNGSIAVVIISWLSDEIQDMHAWPERQQLSSIRDWAA